MALRRLILLVSAIVLVDTMFYAAIAPLLPYYADRLELSKSAAGILTGAYPAGTLLGSLPAGWLAARAGVKPTVLLGLALLFTSSLAFGLAPDVALLDAARFLQGLGGAACWAGGLAWLVSAAPRERRAETIGTAFGAAIGGALLGPVLGAAAGLAGPAPVFSGVACLGAALAGAAWREPPPPRPASASRRSLRGSLRERRVGAGMAAIALVGLFFGVVEVLVPLRLDELGGSGVLVGATFLAAAGVQAVTSPAVGRVSDRRGMRAPIRAALLAAVGLSIALPWPEDPGLLATVVILGAPAVGALWVPGMALLSDGAEAYGLDQGYAFALVNLVWAIAQTAGSVSGGNLAETIGDGAAYAALAIVCGAALAVAIRRPSSAPTHA